MATEIKTISESQREHLQYLLGQAAGACIDAQLAALLCASVPNGTPAAIDGPYEKLLFVYCAVAEYAICQARYALEHKDNLVHGFGTKVEALAKELSAYATF